MAASSLNVYVNSREIYVTGRFENGGKGPNPSVPESLFSLRTFYNLKTEKKDRMYSEKDAEAKLLSAEFSNVERHISSSDDGSRIEVNFINNVGPCNACKNRIERAAAAWATKLKKNSSLSVNVTYKVKPGLVLRKGIETSYGWDGDEPTSRRGLYKKSVGTYKCDDSGALSQYIFSSGEWLPASDHVLLKIFGY